MNKPRVALQANLDTLNQTYGQRMCSVGSPSGPQATIEHIYQMRGKMPGVFGARVIMFDSGATRWVDFADLSIT